jgi:hypothetical protein
MTSISNEYMQEMLPKGRPYCVLILKSGPLRDQPDAEQIHWEHTRYLFQLCAAGKLAITLPVMDNTELMGVGVLNIADLDEAHDLLKQDPNIKAGRLVYEVHSCFGFPGDALAG